MSQRISHSLLDPYLGPSIKALYPRLPIPRRFPPEGIIAAGHLLALLGAVGLAYAPSRWWGGLLAAVGIAGNHLADCLDGTHARSTGQCRNGGELLDHFTDPLSFSYWITGLAVASGQLAVGLAGVIVLYATAVLTNIKAKMLGRFTLHSFGPTEFKALLVLFGLAVGPVVLAAPEPQHAVGVCRAFLHLLLAAGIVQLAINLVRSIHEVNTHGAPPDVDPWITRP